MARITVEDCLKNVDNRFELVMVSSKRARQIALGTKEALVPWENDKATVVALREIEQGLITASILVEKKSGDFTTAPSSDETEVTAASEDAIAEATTEEPAIATKESASTLIEKEV